MKEISRIGGLYNPVQYGKKLIVGSAFLAIAALGCNDDGGGGNPDGPQAIVSVTQPAKEGETLTFDGSISLPGDRPITAYRFDFDNDSSWDYEETQASAPDGTFDGITTHAYPDAIDITARMQVETAVGTHDITTDLDIGYGANRASAIAQIEAEFGVTYTRTQDQLLYLPLPAPGMNLTAALEASKDSRNIYTLWENDHNASEISFLDDRVLQGYESPVVIRIFDTDSPDTIASLIATAKVDAVTKKMKATKSSGEKLVEEIYDSMEEEEVPCPEEEVAEEEVPQEEVPEEELFF